MGKGRIVSGGTDGLYNVELLHNRERITAELQYLSEQIAQLDAELEALDTERDGLVAERNAIASEIDAAVAAAEEGEIPDVEALLVELAQASADVQSIDARIAITNGRRLQARKREQMLQAVPADPVQQAWCADFSENLTGELGTVEVPAEGVVGEFATWRRVIVRPGFAGRATYSAARDGQMVHREGQVGYQAYFNAAILPGVQRWRPQYRIGVITDIDSATDTCSLTIQAEDSSAQALIIDPPDLQYTRTGVPIEYMDCNADAFEIGDRVLVEFQDRDWSQPKVIGFESNPRECPNQYDVWWLAYRTAVTDEWANGIPDPDTAFGCDTNGSSLHWFSAFELRVRTTLPFYEWLDVNAMTPIFVVDGFTAEDELIHNYPGTVNNSQRLTAEVSGQTGESIDGEPIYDTLAVKYESPVIADITSRDTGLPPGQNVGQFCTTSEYRESWSGPLSKNGHPLLTLSSGQYEIVGWLAVENNQLFEGLDYSVLQFYARAVIKPYEEPE